MPSPRTDNSAARALTILSRATAAILDGYVLAAIAAAALALNLPGSRADAVLIGTMLSFVIYVCAALWAFAASSSRAAWLGLSTATLIAVLLFMLRKVVI